ncbi:MAG: acetolactate synthase small subunit [Anaerolineae bacterium]|nr:acetolactate synthase small subunit [Anaerolineae bacterium]
MKQTLIALVQDHPGVLDRVASLFRRRNFNIESLTVGHSETPGISRMTLVVDCDSEAHREQVVKQFHKLIEVTKVIEDATPERAVYRELALVKVAADMASRSAIIQLVDVFRAQVIDVSQTSLTVEITGDEDKVDSFVSLLRPYGIKELARTGRVAMLRGSNGR